MKAVFATEAEALAFGARNECKYAYECPNCWWWHVTKKSQPYDLRSKQVM